MPRMWFFFFCVPGCASGIATFKPVPPVKGWHPSTSEGVVSFSENHAGASQGKRRRRLAKNLRSTRFQTRKPPRIPRPMISYWIHVPNVCIQGFWAHRGDVNCFNCIWVTFFLMLCLHRWFVWQRGTANYFPMRIENTRIAGNCFMLPKTRMLQCHHPNVLRLQPLKQRAGNAGDAVVQELSLLLFPPLVLENFVWIVLSSGTSTGNDPNPPVIMSAECLLTRSMSRSVVTVVRLRPGIVWGCQLPSSHTQGDVSEQNMLARTRRASIWPWSGVVASCCNRTSCNRPLCHHFVLLLLGEM